MSSGTGDDGKGGDAGRRWLKRLASLPVGEAAELLVLARSRIRESPVEHAKAAADVTRALSDVRAGLPSDSFQALRRAVLLVARRDWTAAAYLAECAPPLAREHPDTLDWVGEAVARAIQADRTLARQLARTLPGCAGRIEDRDARLRVISALSDLCRRFPGLGLAALPTVEALLDEGSPEGLAKFLEEALDLAGRSEVVARSFLLRESSAGQHAWDNQRDGLALQSVARTLQFYAESHVGEHIEVRASTDLPAGMGMPPGAIAITDGRRIFLVPRLDRFEDPEANFRLYKVATAHEVGRIEFGTFRLDPHAVPGLDPIDVEHPPGDGEGNPVLVFASRFEDEALAQRVLLFAEDLRVDACLRREYPGLARDIEEMANVEREDRPDIDALEGTEQLLELLARRLWYGETLPDGDVWKRFRQAAWLLEALRHPGAGVQDSAGAAARLYRLLGGEGAPGGVPEPEPESPQGGTSVGVLRRGGEGDEVGDGPPGDGPDIILDPDGLLNEGGSPESGEDTGSGAGRSDPRGGDGETGDGVPSGSTRPFHGGVVPDVEDAAQRALEERAARIQRALDARGVPASLREIMSALELDPEVSDRALEQSIIDGFREGLRRNDSTGERGPDRQGEADTGAVLHRYPEWDEQIGDYRPRWTTVWERRAEGNAGAFVDAVLAEHRPMVSQLRREFQMLRPTGLGRERRALDGEELDLDALVEDLVDRRMGLPADGRVYQRRRYSTRDVAVAFLVDLSASTREGVGESGKSVIEVEKEALVLMCEALEALGDRYGIFGFSGRGRQMVTFDVFKDFGDHYGSDVKGRIGAMTYRMENRDGAAIRHATQRLMEVDARTRLLILLSDGKPLDCGCDLYQASYAQADTRTALREARAKRVHPFCITVDPQGEDYLEEMYGAVWYAVIDSVAALPSRLPGIYRRLTT